MSALLSVSVIVGLGLSPQVHAETVALPNEPYASVQLKSSEGRSQRPEWMASRKRVNTWLNEELDRERYAFCHDASYRFSDEEGVLCDLATGATESCPAFAEACGVGIQKAERERNGDFKVPSWLAGLAEVAFWGLLLGGFGFLGLLIVRHLAGARRLPAADLGADIPDQSAREVSDAPHAAGEKDVQKLMDQARSAAQRGDFVAATDSVYRATLRHLEAQGKLTVDACNTNGDYERSVASNVELRARLSPLLRSVESMKFGAQRASQELFDSVIEMAMPIVSRAWSIAWVLAASSLMGGCNPQPGAERADFTCGSSPLGLGVFCGMLAEQGTSAKQRVQHLHDAASISEDVSTLIVIEAELDAETWEALASWTEQGNLLLLATHDNPLSDRLGVRSSGATCRGDWSWGGSPLHELSVDDLSIGLPEAAGLVVPAFATTHLRCGEHAYWAELALGHGTVIVLADGNALSNASLAAYDNAVVGALLSTSLSGDVEIVGQWAGAGAGTAFSALARSGMLPWLLHLLLVLLVFGLAKGIRFGSPRDPRSAGRHAFSEHVKALGQRYAHVQASDHVLAQYGSWVMERLRLRAPTGQRSSVVALAEALAHRTGRRSSDVLQLLVHARSAQDSPESERRGEGDNERAEQLAAMRALGQLLSEVEHAQSPKGKQQGGR